MVFRALEPGRLISSFRVRHAAPSAGRITFGFFLMRKAEGHAVIDKACAAVVRGALRYFRGYLGLLRSSFTGTANIDETFYEENQCHYRRKHHH